MVRDLYDSFAERTYLFDRPEPELPRFFEKLVRENDIRTVLDCACGGGFELLTLHSLGCEVVGSDLSEAMLDLARRNLAEAEVELPLEQADYRELPARFGDTRFDAVLCLSASIIHVEDDGDALRAFRSMHGVLEPGGVLVLDQGISDSVWKRQNRFLINGVADGAVRLYALDFLGSRDARFNILDVFDIEDKGRLEVWSADCHILLHEQQQTLLREAGFSELAFYGAYDFEPYDRETSRRLIAVARK